MISTARALIDALGGQTVVAIRLGTSRQAVHSACVRGRLAGKWHYRLARWARTAKLHVHPALFGDTYDGNKEVHGKRQPQPHGNGQGRGRGEGQAERRAARIPASRKGGMGDGRQPDSDDQQHRRGESAGTAGHDGGGFYDRHGTPIKVR